MRTDRFSWMKLSYRPWTRRPSGSTTISKNGYSGFLVGRCELGCGIPFPFPSHNLYEGKGIRGTSHLSTISASAPQSAFHRSTVLKCGRLPARGPGATH